MRGKKGGQYLKVIDFQGFVTNNGEFVAADLGNIEEGADKSQYDALHEAAGALGKRC